MRNARFVRSLTAGAVACMVALATAARATAQELPSRLDDSTYWKLVTDFSEPGGYFRSDNFVSNEMAFQYVIPTLLQTTKPGGVYLGVGPDQNLTYIVALRPKLAFIFDIRRGNLQEHLLYKAVIEMSDNRADFLSRLFSRPRPAGLDTTASADSLLNAYAAVPPSDSLYQRNLKAVKEWLTTHHHFALGDSDLAGIEYVYSAFSEAGPELTYNFGGGRGGNFRGYGRGMPTYADLMVQTDGQGAHRGYIASEANYRALRQQELDNAIVPLVGNFAGDKAIRAVASYLKEHHATVTAFYLSNVEQYLWNGSDDGQKFFENVATLPLDSASTFIRAVFNRGGYGGGGGMRGPTILASMMGQLAAYREGHINSYYDVIQYSK
ncbi:MAG: hypothetical protein ACREN6_10480 [Gemmatimonadaceae bacterium]